MNVDHMPYPSDNKFRGVFVHFESKQQNSTKVTTGVSVPKTTTQDHVCGERE